MDGMNHDQAMAGMMAPLPAAENPPPQDDDDEDDAHDLLLGEEHRDPFQTLMRALRMGVAYMAMLYVMSFNGGVFLAAVAGHAAGFLVFGSRVFRKAETHAYEENTDLPLMRAASPKS